MNHLSTTDNYLSIDNFSDSPNKLMGFLGKMKVLMNSFESTRQENHTYRFFYPPKH